MKLQNVADVGKAGATGNLGVPYLMKPPDTEDATLEMHVKCLYIVAVAGQAMCTGAASSRAKDRLKTRYALSCSWSQRQFIFGGAIKITNCSTLSTD